MYHDPPTPPASSRLIAEIPLKMNLSHREMFLNAGSFVWGAILIGKVLIIHRAHSCSQAVVFWAGVEDLNKTRDICYRFIEELAGNILAWYAVINVGHKSKMKNI